MLGVPLLRLTAVAGLLLVVATPALCVSLKDYTGQYVLRLGDKNFLVLRLEESHGKLGGTLSRPLHASLGSSFSKIGAAVLTERITSARVIADHLHIQATNPQDPSDSDDYELTLQSAITASLQLSGVPIDPWMVDKVALLPRLAIATNWDLKRTYLQEDISRSNPEMQRIMEADQEPRQTLDISQMAAIDTQDQARREQVLALLAKDALHSGTDFEQAAFVFQHGSTPGDYLLAHTLAMIAVARGNAGALWIASATLDRYLKSMDRPQVFGTQFNRQPDGNWSQEPYNRVLVSDKLRRKLGVPSQAAQQKQLEQYRNANPH